MLWLIPPFFSRRTSTYETVFVCFFPIDVYEFLGVQKFFCNLQWPARRSRKNVDLCTVLHFVLFFICAKSFKTACIYAMKR